MRVTMLAVGSRGDVQPSVALGLGLKQAGYQVRLATHLTFRDLVLGRGLEFAPLAGDPQQLLAGESGKAWLESGRNPISFMRRLLALAAPVLERHVDDAWDACQGAQAIIFSALGIAGYHIAERMRVPSFSALLQPSTPTRYFPSMLVPPQLRLGGSFNLLTHLVWDQIFWQPTRRLVNRKRTQLLQLPPLPVAGPYRHMREQHHPVLYGYSRHVLPRPRDWGEWIHVTGYWFLDREPTWQPPEDLLDFLSAGPPPVYIGFGSMSPRNAHRLTVIALEALALAGSRGVLLAGWAGLGKEDMPADVFLTKSIPHDWLFPQMSAVVHHGGAGTTAAGLCAGVPSIVVPVFGDQYFWGQRVEMLGAGPKMIPLKHLTAERLATSIALATTGEQMKARASELGRAIRSEDGVTSAVAAFRHHLT